ncbi:MAG: hypothetical protein K6L75_04130 [Cellvibrionaceae bacterium]
MIMKTVFITLFTTFVFTFNSAVLAADDHQHDGHTHESKEKHKAHHKKNDHAQHNDHVDHKEMDSEHHEDHDHANKTSDENARGDKQ